MSDRQPTAVGVFKRREEAEVALRALQAAGLPPEHMCLLTQPSASPGMDLSEPGSVARELEALGVPDATARWSEEQFRRGGTLVAARAPGRHQQVEDILLDHGATEIHPGIPTPTARHRGDRADLTPSRRARQRRPD